MVEPVRRGKLAYKFLFWFLLVSLAPILVVGYNLISIFRTSLKDQTQRNQEAFAVGFANTVWNFVNTYKSTLVEAAHQEDLVSSMTTPGSAERQNQALNLLMQAHAPLMEISLINTSGQEILRKGRFLGPTPPMRDFSNEAPFRVSLQNGEYIGSLERFGGLYPTLTLAVLIIDTRSQPARPLGVLVGKLGLNGLTQMLNQQFPPEAGPREAAVVSPDGFLIAHSNPKMIFKQDARLPKEVTDVVLTQTSDKGGGEIQEGDGTRLLAAYSGVRDLGWVVYIQEPIESAYASVPEMTSKTLRVLLSIIVITILLSLAVAAHITQPIRILQQAVDRVAKGQFEGLPEMGAQSDEIGELSQTFLQMAESLREKTGELVHAKEELEKFTKFLERRVEARTRELKAAQDELIAKERLAAIGQMASVVGHEIRNPLAVINNSTYFIKTKLSNEGAPVDPKIVKHISIIESEIKQANGIINEILTFSRTRPLNLVVVAVNNFLDDILSVHPFPSNIQAVREFTPANPVVNIDADEMRQAVRNLIGNGVEVMPNGGIIKVATEIVEDAWVRIDVSDSGSGIPPEILEKIFAPFFTTKARGTGLGLAVVRKVVDRHKGKVDVTSAVGKGTTFHIFLPIAAKAGPAPVVAAEQSPAPLPLLPDVPPGGGFGGAGAA